MCQSHYRYALEVFYDRRLADLGTWISSRAACAHDTPKRFGRMNRYKVFDQTALWKRQFEFVRVRGEVADNGGDGIKHGGEGIEHHSLSRRSASV